MPLCKAVTDRRYRRNWSVRFIDALYELQVRRRARLSAPLQGRVQPLQFLLFPFAPFCDKKEKKK